MLHAIRHEHRDNRNFLLGLCLVIFYAPSWRDTATLVRFSHHVHICCYCIDCLFGTINGLMICLNINDKMLFVIHLSCTKLGTNVYNLPPVDPSAFLYRQTSTPSSMTDAQRSSLHLNVDQVPRFCMLQIPSRASFPKTKAAKLKGPSHSCYQP